MTGPKLGATLWKDELDRAVQANRSARLNVRKILDDQPSGQVLLLLLGRVASSLGENLEALRELERIGEEAKRERKK